MARIRSIKPEIASDARLARVSRGTRYHFVLLWTVCDDAGFFRAGPRQLLGQLYPHDSDVNEAEVSAMTAQLADLGLIAVHVTADGPIGCVTNWLKHQIIDRPSKSHLRECVSNGSRAARDTPSEGVLSPESRVLSPESSSSSSREELLQSVPNRKAWEGEIALAQDGAYGPRFKLTDVQVETACRHYLGNGALPNLQHFKGYLRTAAKGEKSEKGGPVSPDDFNARLDAYVRDHPEEEVKANA